jgi:hypothetical protein
MWQVDLDEVFGCTRLAVFSNSGRAKWEAAHFSRFFSRKQGAEEQKTTCGLWTGIFYGVLRGDPEVAGPVFPEHWAPKRYTSQFPAQIPERSISDSQVKAAFDKLLAYPERLSRFTVCPFIDGPDEFDEPAATLWASPANYIHGRSATMLSSASRFAKRYRY